MPNEHSVEAGETLEPVNMPVPGPHIVVIQAQRGVREVLEGTRASFSMEYPCHSPTEERWFVMHVSPVGGEQPGAVVSHINITGWRNQNVKTPT